MLIDHVARTVKRFEMIRPGDRVLLAVSGGPDSVALTHALFELKHRFSMELTLGHLNHRLRPGSDQDEVFCARLATRLGLRFVAGTADVAGEARRARRSLEEQGRLTRYFFLEKTAQDLGCDRIAVGHTRDDQAETFLLRLLRGAGSAGLAGIYPVVEGRVIRPLLEVRRREVLEFLAARGLPYRTDETNADRSIPRNRVRHESVPYLEEHFNPRLVEALARTADLLREDEDWLQQETERAFAAVAPLEREKELRIEGRLLWRLHPALRRRVVRRSIEKVRGDLRSIAALHVEEVLELLSPGKSGCRLSLPGVEVGRSFGKIWLRPAGRDRGEPSFQYDLRVPGRVEIPEAGGSIEVEESVAAPMPAAAGMSVMIGMEEEGRPLKVRNARPGDRFQPLGAPGSKALSRYLMERKVERRRRLRVPVVVGGQEILWVVGHAVSELSRVGPNRRRLLQLRWLET